VFALFAVVSLFLYTGSIDQARAAKVMARRDKEPVRIAALQRREAAE